MMVPNNYCSIRQVCSIDIIPESAVTYDIGSLAEPSISRPLDMGEESSLCEVLGRPQRAWLEETLDAVQEAPVKLIVTGSVLFGSPLSNGSMGACGGARWSFKSKPCERISSHELRFPLIRVTLAP